MMAPGMNGMAGSPVPGNHFMQQVHISRKYTGISIVMMN